MSEAGATVGWLDCSSGCSGDMLLGALVDAGVPLRVVTDAVAAVAPERIDISVTAAQRAGFVCARVRVQTTESATMRTWADVRGMLEDAELTASVRRRALSTFGRLAEAEGSVHGQPAEDVHFHEVGALDAIADVVGVCAALDHLGLTMLAASPVALGGGTVAAAHGTLPVPAPAVVELLRGVPTHGGPVDVELCTPTGAALLTEWATAWGAQPAMSTSATGVGAGSRDLTGHPNVLRLLIGTMGSHPRPAEFADRSSMVLECNVDDLDPRLWPGVLAALLDAGASDAWLTPILMKKGRPAHTLSVLATSDRVAAVRRVVFTETTTLGIRESPVGKHVLQRRDETVDVDGQRVRVKLGVLDGTVVNAQPEYDDVVAAAAVLGQPVKSVLSRAAAQARPLW
jgi:pyridinium-3,5-bisthiocarboxylic acid mononucleotide nickel chelatase